MPVFMLAGCEFNIDRTSIDMKAACLKPEQMPRHNYTVVVGGKSFPIKQLLAEVVNLPPTTMLTLDAYKVLTELGYDVKFNR